MGLDIVVLFCVLYSGLALVGMWFFMGPPRQEFLEMRRKYRDDAEATAPAKNVKARVYELRSRL